MWVTDAGRVEVQIRMDICVGLRATAVRVNMLEAAKPEPRERRIRRSRGGRLDAGREVGFFEEVVSLFEVAPEGEKFGLVAVRDGERLEALGR